MNESPFSSKQEEEEFKERMLLMGVKMTAVRMSSDLPKNKPAFFLQTKNVNLYRDLKGLALRIDAVILYNPEESVYEDLKKIYAFVIDEDLIKSFPFQDLLIEKYVKAELELDLLESILTDMKK